MKSRKRGAGPGSASECFIPGDRDDLSAHLDLIVLFRFELPDKVFRCIYLQMQDKDGKPLVPLPPVEITMIPVALTPKARVRC